MNPSHAGAVHEWGTFTSVAAADGTAVRWEALAGKPDLPCFVHSLDQRNCKAAAYGTVRMETPVMYFYPAKPMSISVDVDFPNGRVTEWYLQAADVQPASNPKGWIEWKDIQVGNNASPLPKLSAASHYYAARETDASILKSGQEVEKLLFYRGIADFDVDLQPVVRPDSVIVRNGGTVIIPNVILSENHAGKVSSHVIPRLDGSVNVSFPISTAPSTAGVANSS